MPLTLRLLLTSNGLVTPVGDGDEGRVALVIAAVNQRL